MPADTAKYLLSIADIDPKTVEITAFSAIGAIKFPQPHGAPKDLPRTRPSLT